MLVNQGDEALWHKCHPPIFPRRTVDEGRTWKVGQTWRRRNAEGKWEYKQDEETLQEYFDRQY
jgi:hypothetical protein